MNQRYLKLFETESEYNAYITGGGYCLPNVSYVEESDDAKFTGSKWNQLIWIPTAATFSGRGIKVTNNKNGSYTLSGTSDSSGYIAGYRWSGFNVISGHSYFVACNRTSSYNAGLTFSVTNYGSIGTAYMSIRMNNKTGDPYFAFNITSGLALNNYVVWPQCIDLTEIYGKGNEPTTVDQFLADHPQQYYPYCPL